MAASSLQKCHRLQISARLGVIGILCLVLGTGCAASLREEKDISQAPAELNQKIEALATPPPTTPEALPPTVKDGSVSVVAPAPEKAAQVEAAPPIKEKKAKKEKHKKIVLKGWTPSYWPFGIGEKLTYTMRYGVIEGGIVTFEFTGAQKVEGEPVLHFRGEVKSSKVLELFYKIDDSIDSWVRLSDFLPVRQELKQLESPKWGRRVVVFDKNNTVAKYYSNTTFKDGKFEEHRQNTPLLNFPQDVFGSLYFYRFLEDLKAGVNFPIYDHFENWNNEFSYEGTERVAVPAGTFQALKIKMKPRITGQLEPKGDVFVWLKDDPSHLLLKFKAMIKVGSITGELKKYQEGSPVPFPLPHLRTPTTLNEKGELKTTQRN